ncbi:MAG: alpha-glucuronidase [Bacteroidaceae bacterium]|nr:alpha-glucuronidase [Bacteroidaceae bacterium]
MKKLILLIISACLMQWANAENGSKLWLRDSHGNQADITSTKNTKTTETAIQELRNTWRGIPILLNIHKNKNLKDEGYTISKQNGKIQISSPTDRGILYGTYHLLRLQAMNTDIESKLPITENPSYDLRILNHWDNLDGTIERGYAGQSLWQWEELPNTLSPRYIDYARANASIGINGTVLNNVNASPQILSATYLQKVKALADLFRPYGIKVYLSANFASPMVLDNLPTADPLDKEVIRWWKNKAKEIYRLIPDFGGFLVKANSEGQPGPCDFGRTHAEGANMLADALKPYKGIVMWRAFVYSPDDADRAKQAYQEFKPLDGQFRSNVIIQTKNGPVDFQPREPYSPLFTAIEHTDQMVEFQITQEYLGHSNHIAYLAPMWKEFFDFVPANSLKAIAGVSNIGTDVNWCGHPFAQSNWYAFGRLAWNPSLSSEEIADEWLKQTFSTETVFVEPVKELMLQSREAVVDYMMPMGLHHLFAWGHHYGPEPWCAIPGARPDWMPSYYHKADKTGIGFDRSSKGSNAVAQYPSSLAKLYDNIDTCPEEYILWFHHVPWTYKMKNGTTLWESLCRHYDKGVQQTKSFQKTWDSIKGHIDNDRFYQVQSLLKTQTRDAIWWKDACLLYFQEFSQLPFPSDMESPIHDLDELKKVNLGISNFECPTPFLLNKNR